MLRTLVSTALLVALLALTPSCTSDRLSRVGHLDPEAADPVLPTVVGAYVDYVEADDSLTLEEKGDRRFAAEQLEAWWQAGMDAKALAKGEGE
ncbi:MAG: hypothetical protein AAFZ65_20515 [Planctomycetota bacterium]